MSAQETGTVLLLSGTGVAVTAQAIDNMAAAEKSWTFIFDWLSVSVSSDRILVRREVCGRLCARRGGGYVLGRVERNGSRHKGSCRQAKNSHRERVWQRPHNGTPSLTSNNPQSQVSRSHDSSSGFSRRYLDQY